MSWFRRRRSSARLSSPSGRGWSCHVCGRWRPDELISVHTTETVHAGGVRIRENVRYCNDTASCAEGARSIRWAPDVDAG